MINLKEGGGRGDERGVRREGFSSEGERSEEKRGDSGVLPPEQRAGSSEEGDGRCRSEVAESAVRISSVFAIGILI